MNSIATQNLAVVYEDNLVMDDLDMRIPQGRIAAIIRPSGCGKSTVLKAVGRISKPKGGVVYLNGGDIHRLTMKEVAQKMAILPQSPQTPTGLTVGELATCGRFPHQRGSDKLIPEDKRIIQWALEMTRLMEFETIAVDNLPGGQWQRVRIVMVFAQQTDLILLDEPTTYPDLAYQLEVLELPYRLNREQSCTIVMVLHDLNLVARFADYVIAIRGRDIIQHGTPEEMMTAGVLEETFHIDVEIVKELHTGRPTCISYDLICQAQDTTGIYKKVNQ